MRVTYPHPQKDDFEFVIDIPDGHIVALERAKDEVGNVVYYRLLIDGLDASGRVQGPLSVDGYDPFTVYKCVNDAPGQVAYLDLQTVLWSTAKPFEWHTRRVYIASPSARLKVIDLLRAVAKVGSGDLPVSEMMKLLPDAVKALNVQEHEGRDDVEICEAVGCVLFREKGFACAHYCERAAHCKKFADHVSKENTQP